MNQNHFILQILLQEWTNLSVPVNGLLGSEEIFRHFENAWTLERQN